MIGEKLKQLRKSKGMNQEELARLSGVSRNSIVNWETGKRMPRADDIARLALVFGVSERELYEGKLHTHDADKNYIQTPAEKPQQLIEVGSYAYWGGILDETKRMAEREDIHEISLVAPLLRAASDILSAVQERLKAGTVAVASGISAYNGNHSNYNGNQLNVAKV